jgi:hypothetical protein
MLSRLHSTTMYVYTWYAWNFLVRVRTLILSLSVSDYFFLYLIKYISINYSLGKRSDDKCKMVRLIVNKTYS